MRDTAALGEFPLQKSFAGWRALITGGSSGIGLALGKRLAAAGAHVCLAARDADRLARAVDELRRGARGAGQTLCSVVLDVASPASIDESIPRILEALGGLDLLVNNAGHCLPGYVHQLDEADYQNMLAVNYLGPVRVIRALLPHFLGRRSGHIVNVTSMLGFMGAFGYGAYSGSKYALSGYTECLRQDLLPFGIRVYLCYPPTTRTPGLERENLIKPAETWAIESTSQTFEPEQVASAIMTGLRRKRFHILVGLDSWLIWFAQRVFPWLVRWVTDRLLLKYLRAHPEAGHALPAQHASRRLARGGP